MNQIQYVGYTQKCNTIQGILKQHLELQINYEFAWLCKKKNSKKVDPFVYFSVQEPN